MIVTQGNVAAIFRGYNVIFSEAFAASAPPLADNLAVEVNSTGLTEEHNWLSATQGIRKLVDEAVINELRAQNYFILNEEFEETLTLRQIEVATDKFGLLGPRLQILGANGRAHPDELLANLFVKGLDGSGIDYTGTSFFAANKRAYPEAVPFTNVDTGRLTAARFEAARANLKNRRNAAGRPLGLGMDLRLITSPTYEGPAKRILEAENDGAGATNINKGTAKLVTWPWLTAVGLEHAWFLADFGSPLKPFIRQKLIPWTTYTIDNPQSEYVVLKHKFLYQIYMAGNIGFAFPETIWGSDGSVI